MRKLLALLSLSAALSLVADAKITMEMKSKQIEGLGIKRGVELCGAGS